MRSLATHWRSYGLAFNLTISQLCHRAGQLPTVIERRRGTEPLHCPRLGDLNVGGDEPAGGRALPGSVSTPTRRRKLDPAHQARPAGTVPQAKQAARRARLQRVPARAPARVPAVAPAGLGSAPSAGALAPGLGKRALPVCDTRCSAHEVLFAQIDNDLAAFPKGITKDLIDLALRRWPESAITASIIISNGTIFMTRPFSPDGSPVQHNDGQMVATLHEIWHVVQNAGRYGPPLPDSEFLINADDYGRAFVHLRPWLPLLSITKEIGRSTSDKPHLNQVDILYPAGHYSTAGIVMKAIGNRPSADVVRRFYRHPWKQKQEVALFRGRPNTHTWSRWALSRLKLEGDQRDKKYLDIGLVW